MMMGSDPSKVAGARFSRRAARRVLSYARPYRGAIVAFVTVIVLESVLALVPIFVFKRIIDVAIPDGDRTMLHVLAVVALVSALIIAGLSFVERYWSSRIGEGLIYDLRVELFDHVSAMPIGFFTRTQTGALMSRMNNDVIGAQRAVTTTLGSVVSNVIVLGTTLAAEYRKLFSPAIDIAAEFNISERQLERKVRDAFGLPLRDMRRIVRFGLTLPKLLDPSVAWGDLTGIAQECGYFDQAHMHRDFTELSGLAPTELVRKIRSDDPAYWMYRIPQPDFNRLYIPVD